MKPNLDGSGNLGSASLYPIEHRLGTVDQKVALR